MATPKRYTFSTNNEWFCSFVAYGLVFENMIVFYCGILYVSAALEVNVEIRVLRELFREGMLLSATIVPVPLEQDRWMLMFEKSSGGVEYITRARSKDEKVYKRINGALVDARDIGFQRVTIEFSDDEY